MQGSVMKKRSTPGKLRVREVLEKAGSALSQDRINLQLNNELDRVTLYRILNGFVEDGIVHRAVSDDGKSYYALCRGCEKAHNHEHAHFRCLSCERVECLPAPVKVALPPGYAMQHSNYWLSGTCRACTARLA